MAPPARRISAALSCTSSWAPIQAETHPVTFEYLLRSREKNKAKLVSLTARDADSSFADSTSRSPAHGYGDRLWMPRAHHQGRAVRQDFVSKWVLGFEELKKHIETEGFLFEWAEKMTTIPAATIQQLARITPRQSQPRSFVTLASLTNKIRFIPIERCLLAAVTGNIGRLEAA